MKIVVVALGSAGDVHPFLGIALALQNRGHEVSFLSNACFANVVLDAGLKFHAVGSAENYAHAIADPKLWSPRHGVNVVWRDIAEPAMWPTYEYIRAAQVESPLTVLASPMAFGARMARDALGIRLITGYLAPSNLRTHYGATEIGGVVLSKRTPSIFRKALWRGIDHFILDPLVSPSLNAMRKTLGLRPLKQVFKNWFYESDLAITLFPEWFAAPKKDWPKNLRMGDFPLFDNAAQQGITEELETFLDQGDPPIVFSPGSAMCFGEVFFATSLATCKALGRRGLFLSTHSAHIPKDLPATVRHFDYAPFSVLFKRCALVVHHGGIGTCAQAMRAGVPQLIMPMAHDQFQNAARLNALGVSKNIQRSRYMPSRLIDTINFLLCSESVLNNCARVAKHFSAPESIENICRQIEM